MFLPSCSWESGGREAWILQCVGIQWRSLWSINNPRRSPTGEKYSWLGWGGKCSWTQWHLYCIDFLCVLFWLAAVERVMEEEVGTGLELIFGVDFNFLHLPPQPGRILTWAPVTNPVKRQGAWIPWSTCPRDLSSGRVSNRNEDAVGPILHKSQPI